MKKQTFSLRKRLYSFLYAYKGIKYLFVYEHNSRIHITASIVVVLLGSFYKITTLEWIAIIFSIAMVIMCEIINTIIEKISDIISPNKSEKIMIIKDLAAASVLVTSICAFIIGLLIFTPKIISI